MTKPTREEINARLERIDIRGRQYATVDARVLAFWELFPNGRILTELVSDTGERCVVKATAYDMDVPIATGHAFELKTASAVNRTSYLENCETSAVGRALGFLGIGSNGSIASADEVQSAIEQQAETSVTRRLNRFARFNELKKACIDAGIKKKALDEWQAANIGEDARVFDDAQIKRCEQHFQQLLDDKAKL